jgi:hypothetical protein
VPPVSPCLHVTAASVQSLGIKYLSFDKKMDEGLL